MSSTTSLSSSLSSPLSDSLSDPVTALLQRHRSFFHHRGNLSFPSLLDLFRHFDSKRSSLITKPQFARGLTLAGILLNTEEIESLCTRYQDGKDETRVKYKQYCNDILNLEGTSKKNGNTNTKDNNNTTALSSSSPSSLSSSSKANPASSLDPALSLTRLITRLQDDFYMTRKDPTDLFTDFDPLRHRYITVDQFFRCLKSLGIQLTDGDRQILYSAYCNADDDKNVNYSEFLSDIKEKMIPTDLTLLPTKEVKEFVPTPQTIDYDQRTVDILSGEEYLQFQELVKELGHMSYSRRILVKPSFKHYDRCNRGVVTSAQFDSVISSLFTKARSKHLSAVELGVLRKVYRKDDQYSNETGDLIEYERLCRHLEQREDELKTLAALNGESNDAGSQEEKQQTITSGPISPSFKVPAFVNLPSFHGNVTTAYDQKSSSDIYSLLQSIANWCSQQRIYHIEYLFYDFDKLRKGYVTSDTMWRILLGFRIPLNEQEAALLVDNFKVDVHGGDDGKTVWIHYANLAREINKRQRGEA